MKKGDILLIKNKIDPIAWVIRIFTKSNFNHACIAISETHLIDIRAKKIEIVSVKRYVNKKHYDYKLLRINDLSDKKAYIVLNYILSQKRKYSYITWLISGILILCGKKPLRPTCSSLIANAFSKIYIYFNYYKCLYQITPADINSSKGVINVSTDL